MKIVFCFLLGTCLSTLLSAHPDSKLRLETINLAIKDQPLDFQLYLQRGNHYRQHHNFTLAADDFETAKQTGAPTELYLYHLALLLVEQQQLQAAEIHLQQAISIALAAPQTNSSLLALLYLNLAELYVKQHQWLSAAESYAQVHHFNPKVDSSVYLMSANLFIKAGKNHYTDAVLALGAGLKRHPKMLCLHKQLIAIESQMLQLKKALKQLLLLIEQQPQLIHKWQQLTTLKCHTVTTFTQESGGNLP